MLFICSFSLRKKGTWPLAWSTLVPERSILQWMERVADCKKTREDFVWLIYLYLSKHEFFWHFTVKKTRLPLPAERFSCLYIQWFSYKYAICEHGGFVEKYVFVLKFLVYRGEIKGFGNLVNVLSEKKIDSPREHSTSFPLVTRKCCYLLGKLGEHI